MKILHYSLGFPPYSTGGLTRYATDLAREQARQGHDVSMLWPGKIRKKNRSTVKRRKNHGEVKSFELVGKHYLPQIYGIKDTDLFMQETDVSAVSEFLEREKFDVIHLHTLMGLNKQIINAITKQNIKTIYTTHDFFGICPKTTLFFDGHSCEENFACDGCERCSENALSKSVMETIQSPLFRAVKTFPLITTIRKQQKTKKIGTNIGESTGIATQNENYKILREYFIKILKKVDVIHYNSSYVKSVFDTYFENTGKVLNIVHSNIKKRDVKPDNNKKEKINFTYIGTIAEYKGYDMMVKVMDDLYQEGYKNFTLNVYHGTPNDKPYINVNKPFSNSDLDQVMANTDMLINLHDVSYGFTVVEALSFGKPVFITDKVGAKDLVINKKTGVVCDYDYDSVKSALKNLLDNPDQINQMQRSVMDEVNIPSMENHTKELIKEFYQPKEENLNKIVQETVEQNKLEKEQTSKKIAIVSYYLNKRDTDRSYSVCNYFLKKGYDVSAYCGNFDHNTKTYIKYELPYVEEIKVRPYRKNISFRRLRSHVKFGLDVKKLLKNKTFDYIYVVGPPNSTAWFMMKLTKGKNTKLISDIYDLYPETIPINRTAKKVLKVLGLWIWSFFRNRVIKKGDATICSCTYYYDLLKIKEDATHKVVPLCSGNDYHEIEKPLPKDELGIVYLGAMTNNYDFESLVKLGQKLYADGQRYKFHIIGDGPKKKWLIKELKDKNINYEYYGVEYDEARKLEIMKTCQFGFNGFKENGEMALSYKSMEYMSHSLALINCTKGDTYKLVEENNIGLNYKADQIDKLAADIKALSAEQIFEMQKNATIIFKENFTFDCYKKNMDEIFG